MLINGLLHRDLDRKLVSSAWNISIDFSALMNKFGYFHDKRYSLHYHLYGSTMHACCGSSPRLAMKWKQSGKWTLRFQIFNACQIVNSNEKTFSTREMDPNSGKCWNNRKTKCIYIPKVEESYGNLILHWVMVQIKALRTEFDLQGQEHLWASNCGSSKTIWAPRPKLS